MRKWILPIIGTVLLVYSCTIGGLQFVDRYAFGDAYANEKWLPWLYSLFFTFPIGVSMAVYDNLKYEQEESKKELR